MDLRDFIRITVLSIHDAIVDIENKKGGNYELGADVKRKEGRDYGTIHFDVAVVAGKEEKVAGDVTGSTSFIQVVSLEGGASAAANARNENTSRISFDLVQQSLSAKEYSEQ